MFRGRNKFIHRDGCSIHSNCTRSVSKKSILTSRAVFANQLPRIGNLNGNSGSTGCVRRGRRSMPSFNLFSLYIYGFFFVFFCRDTGLFSPCRRHVLSICREWHLSFLLCYHVQCLTHTSLTPVFGGQSITNAPLITQSTQVPHVPLKHLSRQAA